MWQQSYFGDLWVRNGMTGDDTGDENRFIRVFRRDGGSKIESCLARLSDIVENFSDGEVASYTLTFRLVFDADALDNPGGETSGTAFYGNWHDET